jgi:hypothetical protein
MKHKNNKKRLSKAATSTMTTTTRARAGLFQGLVLPLILPLVLPVVLAGCAQVTITPPVIQLAPPSARILQVDYPTAWSRTIGWFDAHELEITDIDEGFGLIVGRLALPDDDRQVDCGDFNIRAAVSPPQLKKHAKVRVHLSRGFGATSQVLIAVTGQYRLDVMNTYAARMITHTGPCVSRGGIEKQIFAFLKGAAK